MLLHIELSSFTGKGEAAQGQLPRKAMLEYQAVKGA